MDANIKIKPREEKYVDMVLEISYWSAEINKTFSIIEKHS